MRNHWMRASILPAALLAALLVFPVAAADKDKAAAPAAKAAAEKPAASPAPEPVAPAEEAPLPAPTELRLVIYPARAIEELAGQEDSNPELTENLSAILRNRARNGVFEVREKTAWPTSDDPTIEPTSLILDEAKADACQATFTVIWFQDGRRITLIAKIYDVWQRRLVSGTTLTGLDDVSLLNAIDDLVGQMLATLDAEGPRILSEWGSAGPEGISRSLVIRCPTPNTTVSIQGGEVLGTIVKDPITLPFRPLAVDSKVSLHLEAPHYYPKDVVLPVIGLKPELKLPALYPKSSLNILAFANPLLTLSPLFDSKSSQEGISFGVGGIVRVLPLPDTLLVQAGYEYAQLSSAPGMAPLTQHAAGLDVAVSLLTPAEWVVRAYLGIGGGVLVTPIDGKDSPFIDPFLRLPVGILQLNLHPFILEFEVGTRFIIPVGTNLLPGGLVDSLTMTRFCLGVKL